MRVFPEMTLSEEYNYYLKDPSWYEVVKGLKQSTAAYADAVDSWMQEVA